jgi:hypothetical protein
MVILPEYAGDEITRQRTLNQRSKTRRRTIHARGERMAQYELFWSLTDSF